MTAPPLQMDWREPLKKRSPFDLALSATLEVTLDLQTDVTSDSDQRCVAIIESLKGWEELDLASTQPRNGFALIEVADRRIEDHWPVTLTKPNGLLTTTGIFSPAPIEAMTQKAFEDLSTLAMPSVLRWEASKSLGRDIFVTNDRFLLGGYSYDSRYKSRRLTLNEGVGMIGLFLRASGNYAIPTAPHRRDNLGRHFFYSILSGQKLLTCRQLFQYSTSRGLRRFAAGISTKLAKALQARDEIGWLFYRSDYHKFKEAASYHFDYLNLLLGGILDSLAKLIAALLQIESKQTSFRKKQFLEAIQQSKASRLAEIVRNPEFLQLVNAVHLLRNSIHDQPWKHLTARVQDAPEHVLIGVPDDEDNRSVTDHLRTLIRDRSWSIDFYGDFGIEPYGWALKTTRDIVSALERVSGALVNDLDLPAAERPRLGDLFGTETEHIELRARVALLGK